MRQIQVATGNTGTTDVQLAHHALGDRLIVGVQYIQTGVADGATDRQGAVWHAVLRLQSPDTAIHRGFGRTIDVVQTHAWQALTHLPGQSLGQLATATDDIGQGVALAAFFQLQELLQQGRYELHHTDLPLDDQLRQIGRVAMPVRACQHQTKAGAQRPEQLPYRSIEADRRLVQQGTFRGWQDQLRTPLHQVAKATVLDHHAFGRTSGAGGVDHISQMVGAQARHHRVLGRLRRPGASIQIHLLQSVIGKTLLGFGIDQQGQGSAVGQHVGQTLGRIARIQWHVGTTCLEHGQQTDKQVRTTLQTDRHPAVGLHTLADQVMGQAVGGFVELEIAQTNTFAFQRNGIRRVRHLGLEQRLHRLIEYEVLLAGVEIHQQTLTLLGLEQVGLCRNGLIAADHAPQQRLQVRHITLGSGCIEQGRGVIQGTGKTFFGFPHAQGQIELGKGRLITQRLQTQITQMQLQSLTAVPGQRGLEQWAVGQAARRTQALYNLLEWQVLMFLGFQHASLDACQQFSDIRLARGIDTHGQGIDEQTDQPFDFGTAAVGHRCTDDHFVLTGQTRQQHGPGAHEQHERCHAMALTESLDFAAQTSIETHRKTDARVVLTRRTRPVGRQGQQYRRAGKRLMPVVALTAQPFAIQPVALPDGVVGVLQGQWRQRVIEALAERLVQRREFAGQNPQRPAVGNNVMHRQQQYMAIFGQAQQTTTDRQLMVQVESLFGFFLDHGLQGLLVLIAQVLPGQIRHHVCGCGLYRGLTLFLRETAAQAVVACNDALQCAFQRTGVQLAGQLQAQRNVVGAVGIFHLRQEPDPLLGERQRNCAAARQHFDGWQLIPAGIAQALRHGSQGAVGEQIAQGQFQRQALTHLRNHPHRQQGMTAQLEETVVTPYSFDLQQLAPDLRQGDFQFAFRCLIFAGEKRIAVRNRQGATVDLAVGGQWPGIQTDQRAGHHVGGQLLQQGSAQFIHHQRLTAGPLGEIPHQTRLARFVFTRQYQRLFDTRQLAQLALDLAQLNPHTADLHLIVVTPQVFQRAIGIPARQVAGTVHPRPRLRAERIVQEAFGGHFRTVQITTGHTVARHIQLTRHTKRHQLLMLVQQVNLRIGNRLADIQAAIGEQLTRSGHNRGLGRAVVVDHGKNRITVELTQTVATDQQSAQRRVTQLTTERIFGHRRRQERHLQRLRQPPVQQRIQLFVADLRRRQVQGRTGAQRRPDFPGHGVETETGNAGGVAAGVQIEGFAMPVHQIAQGAVFDHHAFGLTGRAGGVDHIGQIGGAQALHQRVVRLLGPVRAVQGNHRHRQRRQTGQQAVLGQHGHRRAVAQQVSNTLVRVRRVHRHVTGTGLEHGQQADQSFQAATGHHGHAIVRAHAQADQVMGQGIGPAVQFAVAQLLVAHLRGDGVWLIEGLTLDALMDGQHGFLIEVVGIEAFQQALALIGRQDFHALDQHLRGLLQSLQQMLHGPFEVGTGALRVDAICSLCGETEGFAQIVDTHHQWVVAALFGVQHFDALPGFACGLGRAVAVVEQGVEQWCRRGNTAAALGQSQRRMFVAHQRGQALMGGLDRGAHILSIQVDADRQGIDKDTQSTLGRLGTQQTPHQYGTEYHALTAGQA
ncbi:hypothetical protein PSCICE_00850 [Pseudomonas cichorii]|nr:hypothetical protein PSCICE_00850 [Pseudomonas cichorii]